MAREREVIATVNPELPVGYDKLDGLEFVKQRDGNVRVNGLLELGVGEDAEVRRLLVPEPDMMWGHDPEDFQRYKADPEKWEMAQKIEKLEARLSEVEQELSRLRHPVAAGGVAAETVVDADEPEAGAAADAPSPDTEEQPAVAEPAGPETAEAPETPVEVTETTEVETPNQRSWWQRTRDRVMGPVYGNHARAATITRRKRYEYDEQGRTILEEEVSDERQRRTGLMAGATALVGAGVGLGLGYLIWHKTGHDVNNYYDFNINHRPDSVPGATDVIPGNPGAGGGSTNAINAISGSHMDYHNNLPGHRQTGALFTKNLGFSHDNAGHDIIINETTKATVVSHEDLPNGMFDSQRKLSRMAMSILRRKGYSIVDGGQDPGHMSIVLES